ncbi:hypothetical protein PC116_g26688 [Phytophthora cactorum]|nr:hypothetical protein PC116_g26688 [Phytophthora cactorum]
MGNSPQMTGAPARVASTDAGVLVHSKKLCFFIFSVAEVHRFRTARQACATSAPTRSSQPEVVLDIQCHIHRFLERGWVHTEYYRLSRARAEPLHEHGQCDRFW